MTTLTAVTADELRAWMTANGYTIKALTLALKMPASSMRTVQRWRDGTARIPPYLELALQSLGSRTAPATRNPLEAETAEPDREPFTD